MDFTIRDVTTADLDTVLDLNEAAVPAVNSLTPDAMSWFAEHAPYFRVAIGNGKLAAFLIGLRPGLDYASLNYRWFCARYREFGYIDRIAVAADARRHGLASKLYGDFVKFLSADTPMLACEVNIRPPNLASMRFHEAFGFQRVGAQTIAAENKEVALLIKTL